LRFGPFSVVYFCSAMENLLEGQASLLLGDELEEVGEEALSGTHKG
jgi:hypothetical protein